MYRHFRKLLRRSEGQSSVEMVAFVPTVAMVLVLLVQGIAAVAAGSDIRDAARDGARALERNESPYSAVDASMPGWIEQQEVAACGKGCIRVTGRVPLGIPGVVTVTRVPISAEATFRMREGTSWG